MTQRPLFRVRLHRIAVAHVNRSPSDIDVMRRRQYVEERFRPEAFREGVRAEDLERYYMERGELQGELFQQ
jgi:hypothetical protein